MFGPGGTARPCPALEHVLGYTIISDVTARDLQPAHKKWFLGRGIDGFAPMGPWIVNADEIDRASLRFSRRISGEVWPNASPADLIFDVPTFMRDDIAQHDAVDRRHHRR